MENWCKIEMPLLQWKKKNCSAHDYDKNRLHDYSLVKSQIEQFGFIQ